jgi:hypothetical protein
MNTDVARCVDAKQTNDDIVGDGLQGLAALVRLKCATVYVLKNMHKRCLLKS